MHVSKLEIKGFKSFGDKVTVYFNEGITGIVGPNGCGKSNIVDAIRWVLGEQKTRNLRSDKMENVIFNGSKNRKPQQLAEVSLTFDNHKNILPTEYAQVTVTRRYFRTGDSEYLLNHVPCRLKDITDLFLDTGIGSDSYAIIELKMVDDILNDKDNSRRTLFEEAAGISKYKVRKKQTLKKLEETDTDLARVEDILLEINKNLKALERQAKLAERYFKLKEEYKNYSLDYARRTITQHRQTLDRLETDQQQEATQKLDIAREITQLEADWSDQKNTLDQTQQRLAAEQQQLNAQTAQIRQRENDIQLKSERINYLQERLRALRQQIHLDTAAFTQTQASITALQHEAADLQTVYQEVEQEVRARRQDLEEANNQKAAQQGKVQRMMAEQRTQQNQVFQRRKDLEITQLQLAQVTAEGARLAQTQQTAARNAAQFRADLVDLEESLALKNQEWEQLTEQENQLRAAIAQTEINLQQQRTLLQDLNRQIDAKQNQYTLTKSLVDNLEGFPEAIKFLYQSGHWSRPAPLLADLITCEPVYQALIESYLEPYLNFFVVDTTAEALAAVQLLRDQHQGRANFIILAEVDALAAEPTKSTAQLKAAYELVAAAEKYQGLLRYMLHDVYLAPDGAEHALSDDRTLIWRDGSMIKKPLSVAGGSVGVFDGNRLGRKQNLELLARELADLTAAAEQQQAGLHTLQQVLLNHRNATQAEKIKQLEKNIATQQQELTAVRIRHEQHALSQTAYENQVADFTEQLEELRYKSYELAPRAEEAQAELQQLEVDLQALNDALARQNENLQQLTTRYNQENIHFHQLKNRLGSLQQEIIYKQKSLEPNQARLHAQEEEVGRATDEIYELRLFVEENTGLVAELNAERHQSAAALHRTEADFFTLRGEIDVMDKTTRELQRKRQHADEIYARVQQAANETKLQLVAVRERLLAEFNLSEAELLAVPGEALSLPTAELTQRIAEVKTKLDQMGPVNPMAAQSYAEMHERHRFIQEQHADLRQAKATLLQTMAEMDQMAQEKYLTSFALIKNNFARVFQSLFSEDDACDLIIADPANPLESKIEIMARPKGKRPLTINQLSGGEKTLTAISLLFAIYLLKPAPFCIFDEVDAPLDDANIDKFNHIVKKFSGESQFIVVTHNKRTMAATDVIYGVTMLEPGVSRVIPVDLRQLA